MKIRPVEAALFHVDRRTDMGEANGRFLRFYKRALKKKSICSVSEIRTEINFDNPRLQ
jgi:hypothetical protein